MAKAEVKITMSTSDYQALKALLQFHAEKITEEQLMTVLDTLGYATNKQKAKQTFTYIAELMVTAIG